MTLQEKIKKHLIEARKIGVVDEIESLRVILGEFSRQPNKILSDEIVIEIIKKLKKSEEEVIKSKGLEIIDSDFIDVCNLYLPKNASNDEIIQWIKDNINFDNYKNKMQAMKDIMTHFKNTADGNTVKTILLNNF